MIKRGVYDVLQDIPVSEYQDRVARTREEMKKAGYDALILFSDPARMVNVRWIANYRSFDGVYPNPALVFLPLEGDLVLFAGSDLLPYAKDESWIGDVRGARQELGKVLRDFETTKKPSKIGIVGYQYLDLEFYLIIKDALQSTPIEKTTIVDRLKSIKSETEIGLMKIAGRLADGGLADLRDNLKEGMTEREAVRICYTSMFSNGADSQAFDMMVQSGENSAKYFLARPRDKVIRKGELLLVDIGCRFNGYASDMARGVAFGEVSAKQQELLDVTLEAWLAGTKHLKAGNKASAPDKYINEVLEQRGYLHGNGEGRSCGHGTGMDPEEEIPSMGSDVILEENMSVSYEVTVQIPGVGGSRVEDDVIIRKDGPEFLTHFAHSCQWGV
ncbi:Xaa-Pro dipeptidase [Devosia pacifica]|uniref:Xaa-Pro dipeptidase n=1 Tax=Devosia pacifica TaxID=1335967 RepID=A0A918VXP6_9HYPH|nr:Xaa-Pro peptidase family protein [Devosia pacifica]GHA39355.1 Xaa-Pro dipeptidase [Devosia pacifica]